MFKSLIYLKLFVINITPLNVNLNINNEKQDCKIGTVCVEGTSRRVKEGD
jgi:hypothetical protein